MDDIYVHPRFFVLNEGRLEAKVEMIGTNAYK